jgi:hypothetical protein
MSEVICLHLIYCFNQAMVDYSNVNLPNITTPENSPFLSKIHITEEQVFDHLSTLDISKASGPEGVGARLLKSAARASSTTTYKNVSSANCLILH